MPFVSDDEWFSIQKKLEHVKELEKRVAELEARLARYENSNTPPSLSNVKLHPIGGNKKPGRPKGHKGVGRKKPEDIHQRKSLKLKVCPHCGGKLKKKGKRKRTTTDIQPGKATNTEWNIQRSYCENCDKIVEPMVPSALPNSRFGLTLALYITFLSVLGITLAKIRTILLHDYNLLVSKGTIANTIEQLADYLGDDYERLRLQVLEQKELNADETSHPIRGKNAWLWTFIGKTVAYLRVEKSRGQKVVEKTLKGFNGILTTDCWSAYNKIKCKKQKCVAHLQRDMKFLKKKNKSPQAQQYSSDLRKLFNAALREKECSPELKSKYENKLCRVIDQDYTDKDCLRFNKRFRRHLSEIFTFLQEEIEPTNNKAERSLRPEVTKRKNTYGSYSIEGAQAHAVMASFYQTSQLQQQNYEDFVGQMIENRLQNRTEI